MQQNKASQGKYSVLHFHPAADRNDVERQRWVEHRKLEVGAERICSLTQLVPGHPRQGIVPYSSCGWRRHGVALIICFLFHSAFCCKPAATTKSFALLGGCLFDSWRILIGASATTKGRNLPTMVHNIGEKMSAAPTLVNAVDFAHLLVSLEMLLGYTCIDVSAVIESTSGHDVVDNIAG